MRLFIRTEASPQIGMGHFMRCLAIAEAARIRKIQVMFLINHVSEEVMTRCRPMGISVEPITDFGPDLPGLQSVVLPDDWLLIDSYKATASYICTLHKGARVAVIDDLDSLDRFDCDILVNPAMAAPRASYERKSQARVLLGADYALIRREFRKPGRPLISEPSLAVMFGGSDPSGLTAQVAQTLHDSIPDRLIKVIAGPANSQVAALTELALHHPRLRLFVSPPKVAAVLAGSDLVVTAAGGSMGEVAAMGLPALALVVYDNQKAALDACPFPVIDARSGLPSDLATLVGLLLADPVKRKSIAAQAHAVVDGKGAQRVVEAMLDA